MQTVLIVVCGLVAAYLIGLFLYSRDRLDALIHMSLQTTAQNIAHVTHTVAMAAPGWRGNVVENIDEPYLRVYLTSVPAFEDQPFRAPYGGPFRQHIFDQSHGGELNSARINLSDLPSETTNEAVHRDSLGEFLLHALRAFYGFPTHLRARVSVPLEAGTWLNLEALVPELPVALWSPSLATVAMMTLAIVLISALTVRRMLLPLNTFAQATRKFASDIHAPALPLDGAAEVQNVARSFNDMQDQIRTLLRSRAEMMGAISHDLRTPLSLIKLRAEALPGSEEQVRLLDAVEEMEAMIAATLGLARQSFDMEGRRRLDLAAMVEAICDDLKEADKNVMCASEDGDLFLEGQPLALRRALANLIDNALKYGTRVNVKVFRAGSLLCVEVLDDGPGIPKDELLRVFEPFYRCDGARTNPKGGTGLGLSLVRTVAENHGGKISLNNRPTGGLRAVLALPRYIESTPDMA